MTKKVLFCYVFSLMVVLPTISIAQTAQVLSTYNGPANKADDPTAMVVQGGFIYVTGSSESKLYSSDYVTIKINATTGQQIWVARYNGTAKTGDVPRAIAVGDDGSVYVTGESYGSGAGLDCVTIKYDGESGTQRWVARYHGTGLHDAGKDVKVDAAGNVYVTGSFDRESGGPGVIRTLKYDNTTPVAGVNKMPVWQAVYDEPANDIGESIYADNVGNVYVTGISGGGLITLKYNTSGNTQPLAVQKEVDGKGVKIGVDGNGNIMVVGTYGKVLKYNRDDLSVTFRGNSPLTGTAHFVDFTSAGNDIYVTGTIPGLNGSGDYLTVKYNGTDSDPVWYATYNGSMNGSDGARKITLDGLGNVYVTGTAVLNDGSTYGRDVCATVRYATSGSGLIQEDWVDLYDSPYKLKSRGRCIGADGNNIIVASYTSVSKNNADIYILKYPPPPPPSLSNVVTASVEKENILIEKENKLIDRLYSTSYPNPFRNFTTIEFQIPVKGRVSIMVYDLHGKKVARLMDEEKVAGTHRLNLDGNKLAAGTYFYRLQFQNTVQTKRIVLLK